MKKVSQWENLKTPRYFLYLSTHSPLTEARKMPSVDGQQQQQNTSILEISTPISSAN